MSSLFTLIDSYNDFLNNEEKNNMNDKAKYLYITEEIKTKEKLFKYCTNDVDLFDEIKNKIEKN